jgi:hypothetical protein
MKQAIVIERKLKKEEPLSDNLKVQLINQCSKAKKKWLLLTSEQKHEVLKGMDIAVDDRWILSLIEDLTT